MLLLRSNRFQIGQRSLKWKMGRSRKYSLVYLVIVAHCDHLKMEENCIEAKRLKLSSISENNHRHEDFINVNYECNIKNFGLYFLSILNHLEMFLTYWLVLSIDFIL